MDATRTVESMDRLIRELDRALEQSRRTSAMAERVLARGREMRENERFAEPMRGLDRERGTH